MKRILLFSVAMFLALFFVNAQNVWFNEFHYDNGSTDEGEFIEVVFENYGGYDLSMVAVDLYNESDGDVYDTKTLDQFTMGATSGNFTIFYYDFDPNGIQNGPSDAMSLSYSGTVVTGQFISYEGTLTATGGPAQGMTSVDIGVYEDSSTEIGQSLQLSGTGTVYSDFLWEWPAAETKGQLNNNQSFGTFVPDPEPTNYPGDFEATVEDGKIEVIIIYTDVINVRRELTKEVMFDSSYFMDRNGETKKQPIWAYALAGAVVIWIVYSRIKKAKKKKKLQKKHHASK